MCSVFRDLCVLKNTSDPSQMFLPMQCTLHILCLVIFQVNGKKYVVETKAKEGPTSDIRYKIVTAKLNLTRVRSDKLIGWTKFQATYMAETRCAHLEESFDSLINILGHQAQAQDP